MNLWTSSTDHPHRPGAHQQSRCPLSSFQNLNFATHIAKYFIWKIWGALRIHNLSHCDSVLVWESGSLGVWESWSSGVLEFGSPGVRESWSSGVPESGSLGVPESGSPGVLESRSLKPWIVTLPHFYLYHDRIGMLLRFTTLNFHIIHHPGLNYPKFKKML